jgi:hypothetical protein
MSRITDWIERENARSDAVLATRSTHWLVLRTLFGVAFAVKGIVLMTLGAGYVPYVLGPLAIIAGVALAFESVAVLADRTRRR